MIVQHQHFDLLQKTVLERVIFHPPLRTNASMHNEACFLYAVNGQSRIFSTTGSATLERMEGVVMKCGNFLNNWSGKTSNEEPFEAVAVHFYPEVLKHVYGDEMPQFLKQAGSGKSASLGKVDIGELTQKYIESILFYFENPALVNNDLLILKVKELILLLVHTDASGKIMEILQDLFHPDTYSFKEIISSHLYDNLNLEELAILCNLSLSSFKRNFHEVYKESPARYIRKKRLEKAATLLHSGGKRIADIGFECGFSDTAHFSRAFSAHFHVSPSVYRDRLSQSGK